MHAEGRFGQVSGRRRGLVWAGGALALAAPIGAYAVLVLQTRVDVPVLDDFDAFLGFADGFRAAPTWSERLARLFEPHVDHRIALPRAIALSVVAVSGRLDFVALSLLGNLCLLALFVGLAWGRERDAYGLAALVPVSLLLFQPQPVDVVHWPTASLAIYGVLALAVLAFRALAIGTPGRVAAAWVAGVLALCTQGNGVAVWPAAAGGLWLVGRRRETWRWLALALPPGAVYAATYLGHADAGGIDTVLRRLPITAHYALNFLGAAPAFGRAGVAPAIALALGACAAWLLTRRDRLDPALVALGLFVVITALGNALLRSGMGAAYPLDHSRYRLYSALLVAALHLGVCDRLRGRRGAVAYLGVAIALSAVFSAASFDRYSPEVARKSSIAARTTLRWSLTGEGLQHPAPERAGGVLERSSVYAPAPQRLARFLDRRVERAVPPEATAGVVFGLVRVAGDDALVLVEGWMRVQGSDAATTAVFLVAETPMGREVFTTRRIRGVALGVDDPQRLAFRALIARSDWGRAPVRLGLLAVDREVEAFVSTGRGLR